MLPEHDSTPAGQRGVLWAIREAEHLRTLTDEALRRLAWMELAEQAFLKNGMTARNVVRAADLFYLTRVHPVDPESDTPLQSAVSRRLAYEAAIQHLAFHAGFPSFIADGFQIAWIAGDDLLPIDYEIGAYILAAIRNQDLYWPGDPRMPLPSVPDAFEDGDEGDGAPAATAPEPPTAPSGCTCVLPLVVQQDFLRGHIGMDELLKVVETAPPVGLEAKEWKEALLKRDGVGVVRVAMLHHLPLDLVRALDAEVGRSREKHPGNGAMLKALRRQEGDLCAVLVEGDGVAAVQREALQTACVALRIYLEGDADYASTAPERPVAA